MIQMDMKEFDKVRLDAHNKGVEVGQVQQAQALTQAMEDIVSGKAQATEVVEFFAKFLGIEDAQRLAFVSSCLQAYSEVVGQDGLNELNKVKDVNVRQGLTLIKGGKDGKEGDKKIGDKEGDDCEPPPPEVAKEETATLPGPSDGDDLPPGA